MAEQDTNTTDSGKDESQTLILGKYKDMAAAQKAMEEKDNFINQRNQEVGELRDASSRAMDIINGLQTQNKQLIDKISSQDKSVRQPDGQSLLIESVNRLKNVDFDSERAPADVATILSDSLRIATDSTQRETLKLAQEHFQQALSEKDKAIMQDKFLSSDEGKQMLKMQKEGMLDKIKELSPAPGLEDPLSLTRLANINALKRQNAEMAAKLEEQQKLLERSDGDTVQTDKVFTGQNADTQTIIGDKKLSRAELRQKIIDRVSKIEE